MLRKADFGDTLVRTGFHRPRKKQMAMTNKEKKAVSDISGVCERGMLMMLTARNARIAELEANKKYCYDLLSRAAMELTRLTGCIVPTPLNWVVSTFF